MIIPALAAPLGFRFRSGNRNALAMAVLAACIYVASSARGQAEAGQGLQPVPADAADRAEAIDFDTQIAPLFSRLGCNAAACHGASGGRGSFQLSLFGSDAGFDFDQVVRDRRGRRVHRTESERSLLLLKATGSIDHGGGRRFDPDSREYRLIADWIGQGARRIRSRQLLALRVEPAAVEFPKTGESTSLRVLGEFDDGSIRDLTADAVLQSLDEEAVSVNGAVATAEREGMHSVLVRFMDQVAMLEIAVPYGEPGAIENGESGWVDGAVNGQLSRMGIPPLDPTDDATLFRRWSLDLAGELPGPDDVRAFVSDTSADKYTRTVDRYLASGRFVDLWTWHLAEWLRIGGNNQPEPVAAAWQQWLKGHLAGEASLAQMARESLTASGPVESGATGFFRLAADPRIQAELTGTVWMGVRIGCANCHNHPLDHWKRDDYYRLAACFSGIRSRGNRIEWDSSRQLLHPVSGAAVRGGLPGREPFPSGDPRDKLADWILDRKERWLARSASNRIWSLLMGRGLYEPVDDWRGTNPVSNRVLLDRLAECLDENGYRLRPLIREIALSAAYRRSVSGDPESGRDRFAWRFLPRPIPAPVLLDAIEGISGSAPPSGAGHLASVRPMASPELVALGQCGRNATCSTGSRSSADSGGLASSLLRMNGELLNSRIGKAGGWLQTRLGSGVDDATLLDELYWRAFSRGPEEEERSFWMEKLAQAENPAGRMQLWEDLLWGVLNSREFLMVR